MVQDEDDNALEQELEQLLAEVDAPAKEESMDVDSVVAELVAETLEADDEEVEDNESRAPYQPGEGEPASMRLEEDVDDELLSLIDDKLPSSSSTVKRGLVPSSSTISSLPQSSSRQSKQVPPPLRTSESGSGLPRHTPPASAPSSASTLLGPAARLELESMPPPALSVTGKKDKEQGDTSKKDNENVSAGVTAATSAAALKKKKEGANNAKV